MAEYKNILEELSRKLDRREEDVEFLIDELATLIAESVKDGNTLAIPSFGNFEPKKKLERVIVHPATGKRMLVPPRLTVNFKPSALLRQKVR